MARGYLLRYSVRDGSISGERQFAALPIRIGRNPLNDCPIPQQFVSHFHARIEEIDGRIYVRDLGSKNGVFLPSGERVVPHTPVDLVAQGYEFWLGPFMRVKLDFTELSDLPAQRAHKPSGTVLGNRTMLESGFGSRSSPVGAPPGAAPAQRSPLPAPAPAPPPPLAGPSLPPLPGAPPGAPPSYAPMGSPGSLASGFPGAAVPAVPGPAPASLAGQNSLPRIDSPPGLPPLAPAGMSSPMAAPFGSMPGASGSMSGPSGSMPGAPGIAGSMPGALGAAGSMPGGFAAAPASAAYSAATGAAVAKNTQHFGMAVEILALLGLRELGASLVPGQPLETTGDIARLVTKLHDAIEVFCRCFVPLREGYAQFVSQMDLQQAASQRTLNRSNAYRRVEYARDPAEVAAALLDWRDPAFDAPAAIEGIFADLMLHQVALLDGVMQGVRALLAELAPENIERIVDERKRLSLGRYRALWQTYCERFEELSDESEAFTRIFGREFTSAYREHGHGAKRAESPRNR